MLCLTRHFINKCKALKPPHMKEKNVIKGNYFYIVPSYEKHMKRAQIVKGTLYCIYNTPSIRWLIKYVEKSPSSNADVKNLISNMINTNRDMDKSLSWIFPLQYALPVQRSIRYYSYCTFLWDCGRPRLAMQCHISMYLVFFQTGKFVWEYSLAYKDNSITAATVDGMLLGFCWEGNLGTGGQYWLSCIPMGQQFIHNAPVPALQHNLGVPTHLLQYSLLVVWVPGHQPKAHFGRAEKAGESHKVRWKFCMSGFYLRFPCGKLSYIRVERIVVRGFKFSFQRNVYGGDRGLHCLEATYQRTTVSY